MRQPCQYHLSLKDSWRGLFSQRLATNHCATTSLCAYSTWDSLAICKIRLSPDDLKDWTLHYVFSVLGCKPIFFHCHGILLLSIVEWNLRVSLLLSDFFSKYVEAVLLFESTQKMRFLGRSFIILFDQVHRSWRTKKSVYWGLVGKVMKVELKQLLICSFALLRKFHHFPSIIFQMKCVNQ